MNPRLLAPTTLFAAGLALIAVAVVTGEADVSLFLIFPIISGSSWTFVLGTVLLLLSFVVGFTLLAMGQIEAAGLEIEGLRSSTRGAHGKGGTKYGGVVLVGPVPIAFGSDQRMALAMLVLGIVLAIVLLGVLVFLA